MLNERERELENMEQDENEQKPVMPEKHDEIVIYQSEDGSVKVDVLFENETVWLSQQQMAMLFQKDISVVSRHIKNIFAEGELDEKSNLHLLQIPNSDKPVRMYSLDVIISVGYRVKSYQGTQFRIWATKRLHEYIIKGFTMDDERLKRLGGGNYWRELLDRIRDIRSSEKVLYRQVLDIYATAVDYDPKSEMSIEFFKIVQNKLHFAAHGHTAAEVIYQRADSEQPFMGMTTFKGEWPTLKDALIAKNYLSEDELKVLNNMVSGYFDFAEIQAMRHVPMYMSDYIHQLDSILSSSGQKLLDDAGSVSHQQAVDKATEEYRKWQENTLSPVEEAYLETIKALAAETKGKK